MKIKKTSAVKWFVYLLRCADNSLYTGISTDLSRRVQQHQTGTASRYTRSRLPVNLVYQETQASHSLALKRELSIKRFTKLKKEKLTAQSQHDTEQAVAQVSRKK